MRILLLSDNQAVANVVTLCLDKPGYEIVSDANNCDLIIKDLENAQDDITEFDLNKTLFLISAVNFDTINVPNKIQKPFLPSKLIDFLTAYENSGVDIVAKSLKDTVDSGDDIETITNIVDEIDLLDDKDDDKLYDDVKNTNEKESLVAKVNTKEVLAKKEKLLEILDDDFMDKHSPHEKLDDLIDEYSPLIEIAKELDGDEFEPIDDKVENKVEVELSQNNDQQGEKEISLEKLANDFENPSEVADDINLLENDISLEDFANSILDDKSDSIQKELNLKSFSDKKEDEVDESKIMNFDEEKEDNLNTLKENLEVGIKDLIKENVDENSLKNLKINVVVTFEEK
ncbi:MAG: hypothetical protein MR902_01005 [Campylobacter sp.]|nr:hypothetical protein [Campylobacter sp.]